MRQPKTGFMEVDRARLYYEVAGEGHPLVLIHGFFFDRRMWDDQFMAFARGYRVIRYDVRGFGKSKLPEEPYSDVQDLYSLLRFLNIDKAHVLGLSMGGGIAINFTLEHPDMVDALIPVASSLRGYRPPADVMQKISEIDATGVAGDIPRAIEMFIEMWMSGPMGHVDPAVSQWAREIMKDYSFAVESSPQEEHPPVPAAIDRLSRIHVPTLIVVGDRDQSYILAIAALLEAGIAGARKVVIAGAAHIVNMDKSEEFNRAVLDFLNVLPRL